MLKTSLARLRLLSYVEGISLLILLFVAVPLKYWKNNPSLVHTMGPIHGALFLLFVFNTLSVGVEQRWKFKVTTWKVLVACMIPFGTFYVDQRILKITTPHPSAP